MFINSRFGQTVELLHRTMDVSVMRRQVISNNIANAETPHFKRTDVNFEAELKRAFESQEQRIVPEAQMTDPGTFPLTDPGTGGMWPPRGGSITSQRPRTTGIMWTLSRKPCSSRKIR
jgi:hypothetical protein